MADLEKLHPGTEKNTWGGARAGAGRPKSSAFVSHNKRPRLDSLNKPVKITFRLRSSLPSLCSQDMYSVFHRACLRARGTGLRINHFAIDSNRIQFICEFKNQLELEKSLKSFATTMAIALKKKHLQENPAKEPHKGPVFLGRFQMDVLGSVASYKLALREILVPILKEKDAQATSRLKLSSGVIFQKWSFLFDDENSETRQFVKMSAKFLEKEKDLPYKRIAQEICSTPIFSISRKFEA